MLVNACLNALPVSITLQQVCVLLVSTTVRNVMVDRSPNVHNAMASTSFFRMAPAPQYALLGSLALLMQPVWHVTRLVKRVMVLWERIV